MIVSPPPSLAKVTRPNPGQCYRRQKLFRLVDQARKRSPLLWVCGPPGCGKTALLSSYVGARENPAIWYRVDDGDADPSNFFFYLAQAGSKAALRRRRPLPMLTPEYLPGLSTFTRRFFEDIFGRLKPPALFVFDDCHAVPPDALLFDLLREGLSLLPAGMGAILISRSVPPAALARKQTHRRLEVIGWEELRLSEAETAGIARLRKKARPLPASLINEIHERADGWAAGVVLLLEAAEAGGTLLQGYKHQRQSVLFNYFGAEVFQQLDPEIRDFLQKSAFLPRMTAGMAEALTGNPRAERILSYLNRNYYFTQAHPGASPIYEYHALFRGFLLARAAEALPLDEIRRLQREAACLLETAGQVEDAAGLFQEAGDAAGLVRLILTQAPLLGRQGRFRILEEWIRALPKEALAENPWLLYWLGICRLPFDQTESRRHLETAFQEFHSRQDPFGTFLACSGVIYAITIGFEDLKKLDRWIPVLEDLMKRYGPLPPGEVGQRIISSMHMALTFRQPWHPELPRWEERSLACLKEDVEPNLGIQILASIATFRVITGDVAGIETALGIMRDLARSREANPQSRIIVKALETHLFQITASHAQCMKAVAEGMELSRTTGIRTFDHSMLGCGALSALHAGDRGAAAKLIGEMASTLGSVRPFDISFYHFLKTCEALQRGEAAVAAKHMEYSFAAVLKIGLYHATALNHLVKAVVLHDLGQDEEARSQLALAGDMARRMNSPYIEFLCLMAEASLALDSGQEEIAVRSLRQALAIERGQGQLNLYFLRPSTLTRLYGKALEAGIEVEHVRRLIVKRGLLPEPPQDHVEAWPWPVKIQTLEQFKLLVDGEPVSFSRKVPHRPLALLKVLVALGARDVAEEKVLDLLWPDAEGDLAQQAHRTALARLRGLLGHEAAVTLKGGRLSLSNRHCWVDAFAFERLLVQAEQARKKIPSMTAQAMKCLETALSIYRGPFLPGEDAPWAVLMRERLRSKFLRAVETLGRLREEAGDWEAACVCYRRGLEVDDLPEGFWRRLIACHARLGQQAEALAVFRQCEATLRAALGVRPSPETEALVKAFRPL